MGHAYSMKESVEFGRRNCLRMPVRFFALVGNYRDNCFLIFLRGKNSVCATTQISSSNRPF